MNTRHQFWWNSAYTATLAALAMILVLSASFTVAGTWFVCFWFGATLCQVNEGLKARGIPRSLLILISLFVLALIIASIIHTVMNPFVMSKSYFLGYLWTLGTSTGIFAFGVVSYQAVRMLKLLKKKPIRQQVQ